MQRWLFFTFCFFGAGLLGAQEIDIHTTSVSYWLAGSQSIDSGIAAQADIRFKSKSATDSLLFYPSYLVIHSVRKKEGRLKQYYGFRQMGDSLWIYSLALEPGQVATLHFDYEIPIASPLYQHMVYRDSTVLGFNFFNTDAGVSAGQVGSFYPGIFGDDTRLEMNITTRSGKAVSGPGLPEFKVENGDGTISHFWSSRVSYTPADFYLVVGDFEESDPTKIAGDLPQVSLNVEKLKAQQNQQKLANLMAFTGHPESMTEARMAELQQVSRQPLPGFYLSPADAGQSKDQLQLEKAYLLATSDNDTNQASEKLLAYYQHERGSPWRESLIEDKWRHFANLSKSARQSTLHLKLQAWQDATPWLSELSQVRLDTGLRDRLRHHLKPPSLTMSYRYVASDTAVYVSYVQDTNRAPAYQVPLKLNLVTREDSNFFFQWLRGPEGRLKIYSPQAPVFVHADFGPHFPGSILQQKPDNYYLYQLSHAHTSGDRQQALTALFATENQNLFSTVVGIALTDPSAQLRLEALRQAHELSAPGQRKLQGTITRLSEQDPSEKVRQSAEKLVQKYYN